MQDTDAVNQLAATARRELAEGTTPGQVFAQLALGDADPREAALGVCMAIGIPRHDAEQRLRELDSDPEIWNLTGDERLSRTDHAEGVGELLEVAGTFDLHVDLSPDQRRIADLLAAAMAELLPIGSGYAHRHYRDISTGRLHQALVLLSQPERMSRDINTVTYWQHLVEAADVLGDNGDAEFADAVQRCRARLARCR